MKQAVLSEHQGQFPFQPFSSPRCAAKVPELSCPLVLTTGQPPPPRHNAGYTLAPFRVHPFLAENQLHISVLLVILKRKKKKEKKQQKAIRQDLFWTAGVTLWGTAGTLTRCGLHILPSLGSAGGAGCKGPGAQTFLSYQLPHT